MRNFEAERTKEVIPAGIRVFYEKAARLATRGIDVIDFTIGRPDFMTPAHICQAAKGALDAGQVHYTPNAGIPELRRAIARKALRDYGLHYEPETEIITTIGACEALATALTTFVGPGDEVLVPSPHWPIYLNLVLMNLGQPVFVPLRPENQFRLQAADVRAALTPRTKVLLLNNPHNPTGALLGREDLLAIAEIAAAEDLLIVADEVYEKITFDGAPFVSFASLPGMRERTVSINCCSKTYSMTGWRIGWICAPAALASSMLKMHQQMVTCATSFAQAGAVAALEGPQESTTAMVAEFARRRSVLISTLSEFARAPLIPPRGTFYAIIDVRPLNRGSSQKVAVDLLEEAHVAFVPGSSFGALGEGYLRLSFCCSTERLKEGLTRFQSWAEG